MFIRNKIQNYINADVGTFHWALSGRLLTYKIFLLCREIRSVLWLIELNNLGFYDYDLLFANLVIFYYADY